MAALTGRRPSARARMAMTPDAELELLVAEQERDDTHYVDTPGWQVSLDAPCRGSVVDGGLGDGTTIGERVARDPWKLVDAAIDLGLDPAEVAFSGDLIDALPHRRGILGGGLADPSQIPHATAGGYQNHRCRCIPCTTAWATYSRERRAAKKAAQ